MGNDSIVTNRPEAAFSTPLLILRLASGARARRPQASLDFLPVHECRHHLPRRRHRRGWALNRAVQLAAIVTNDFVQKMRQGASGAKVIYIPASTD